MMRASLIAFCVITILAFQNCHKDGFKPLDISANEILEEYSSVGLQSKYRDDVALVIDPSQYFQSNRFSYAPSTIKNPGSDLLHIYTCHNLGANRYDDAIYYTQAVPKTTGSFTINTSGSFYEGNRPVDWNACDPTVVQGDFSYKGKSYDFAVFYTAMPQDRFNVIEAERINALEGRKPTTGNLSEYNDVRLLLFNSSRRENVFYGSFFSFPRSVSDTYAYGFGQPSAINLDRKGKLLLLYTFGRIGSSGSDWHTNYRVLDISNLDNPVIGAERVLSSSGISSISNGDFAIGTNNKLYVITEEPSSFVPGVKVATGLRLMSMAFNSSSIESGLQSGSWTLEKSIGQSLTGQSLNHNAGFIRDGFGHIEDLSNVGVILTGGDRYADVIEWTYSLHAAYFSLGAGPSPSSCNNGATNYPTCNACASGSYYNGSSCAVSEIPKVCTAGSTSTSGCPTIANGVSRKTCNSDGSGYGSCVSTCNSGFTLSGTQPNVTCSAAVSFTAPGNPSATVSSNPTFSWTSASGHDRYILDVSTSSNFPAGGFANCEVSATATSYSWSSCYAKPLSIPSGFGSSLNAGTTYYWRIVAFKGSETKSSAIKSLVVPNQTTTPTNPTTSTLDYTFSWTSFSGAQVYWIDISQYSDFRWFWNCDSTGTSVNWSTCKTKNYSGVNNPPTMPSGPQSGVTYYYRVVPFVNGTNQGIIKTGSFIK